MTDQYLSDCFPLLTTLLHDDRPIDRRLRAWIRAEAAALMARDATLAEVRARQLAGAGLVARLAAELRAVVNVRAAAAMKGDETPRLRDLVGKAAEIEETPHLDPATFVMALTGSPDLDADVAAWEAAHRPNRSYVLTP